MNQEQIKEIVRRKIQDLDQLATIVSADFNTHSITTFKTELKFFRLLFDLIRLNRGSSSMVMPDKCKKLYHIASVMIEAYAGLDNHSPENTPENIAKWNDVLRVAHAEWKKTIADNNFAKMEKMLLSTDYSRIAPPVLINFFSRHSSLTEKED